MRRIIVYSRVSTDKQGRSGLGLEAQTADIERYLAVHGTAIAHFTEVESGKNHKNRPALLAALEACRRHRATLLIARLDRLARNVAFIASLMESGVEFVAVDMPHASKFTIHILAAVAEHEREIISKRTKAALAAARVRGVKLGGPDSRAALKKANDAKQIRAPALHVIAAMTEMREAGYSYRAIARELDVRDIRTPQGFHWYASTVRNALNKARKHESAPERFNARAIPFYDDVAHERIGAIAHALNRASVNECGGETTHERNHARAHTSLLPDPRFEATPSVKPSSTGREAITEGVAPMPYNIREAECMIDLFTSVGARSFTVTKTDINQDLLWGKNYPAMDLRKLLPAMVRTSAARTAGRTADGKSISAGENLIVRPAGPDVAFVQLDDLTSEQLERLRPAAFLILATSPGNYQAWIAASGVEKTTTKEFVRRVRKAVGDVDKSASGATRVAGSENWKIKYLPEPPVVSIAYGVPGRVMTAEKLEELGLLAAPEPVKPVATDMHVSYEPRDRVSGTRAWPDYQKALAKAPPNSSGKGPDRSLADYWWCYLSVQWGHSIEETAEKLIEVSERARERAQNRDPGYADVTARNAAAGVQRGRNRSRA